MTVAQGQWPKRYLIVDGMNNNLMKEICEYLVENLAQIKSDIGILECHLQKSQSYWPISVWKLLHSVGWHSNTGIFDRTVNVDEFLLLLRNIDANVDTVLKICDPTSFLPKHLTNCLPNFMESDVFCDNFLAFFITVDIPEVGLKSFLDLIKISFDRILRIMLDHSGDVCELDTRTIHCMFADQPENDTVIRHALECAFELSQLSIDGLQVGLFHSEVCMTVIDFQSESSGVLFRRPEWEGVPKLATGTESSQLFVSEECWNLLSIRLQGLSDVSQWHHALSGDLAMGIRLTTLDMGPLQHTTGTHMTVSSDDDETKCRDEDDSAALSVLLPPPVLACLASGSLDSLLEYRSVTTLCALITHDVKSSLHSHDNTLCVHRMVHEVMKQSGAQLRSLHQCAQGWAVELAWGLPLCSYTSNCSRSLFCGLTLMKLCSLNRWHCSVGISTGNCICTVIGGAERRNYLIFGDSTVEAVRLSELMRDELVMSNSTAQQMPAASESMLQLYDHDGVTGLYKCTEQAQASDSMLHDYYCEDSDNSVKIQQKIAKIMSSQFDKLYNSSAHLSNARAAWRSTRSMSKRSVSTVDSNSTLAEPLTSPKVNVVFTAILGSSGTGKSSTLRFVTDKATSRSVDHIHIQCLPGEESTPYGVISKIVLKIVGADNFLTEEQQRNVVEELLDDLDKTDDVSSGELRWNRMKSLSAMFELPWLDYEINCADEIQASSSANEKLYRIPYDHKSDVLDSMFAQLLGVLVLKTHRTIITIDDAHYADELSWRQLHAVLNASLPVAVFFTSRVDFDGTPVKSDRAADDEGILAGYSPCSSPRASQVTNNYCISEQEGVYTKHTIDRVKCSRYGAILAHELCTVVDLAMLDQDDVRKVLTEVLEEEGGIIVSDSLVGAVADFTGGNPYWVNTAAHFIKLHGVDSFTRATATQQQQEEQQDTQTSLCALITCRFDTLSLEVQLVGKYASVIGEHFEIATLVEILPKEMAIDAPQARQMLDDLRSINFLSLLEERVTPKGTKVVYAFQNAVIRATLYNLMTINLLMDLHYLVAQFLEKNQCREYLTLCYHFRKAGSRYLTLKYTVKAAKRSIRHGAFAEGFAFMQAALPLTVSRPEIECLMTITSQTMRLLKPHTNFHGVLTRVKASASSNSTENVLLFEKYGQYLRDLEKTLAYMKSVQNEKAVLKLEKDPIRVDCDEVSQSKVSKSCVVC